MSENSSPSEPGPATAQPPAQLPRARGLRVVVLVVLAATLAVLTANVWLVFRLVERQQLASKEHDFWLLCQPGSSPAEREAAFRHLAAAGNREWRGAQLRDLNLAHIALPGLDLQYADLQGANLARANLSGAKLYRTSLELADLSRADLSRADMSETWFFQATLKGASLRQAKLRAANLKQIQAQNADFVLADLSDAECMMANLAGANLMGADLSGAKLQSAVLKGANLSLARLEGADLTDADFTNTNWWRARGLTTKQLDLLKEKFAPTSAAEPALKEDYAKWASAAGPS